jgi:D-3-phosphoglycerate dehydrogenase
MKPRLILHVDQNHPLLEEGLTNLGYTNHLAYTKPLDDILKEIDRYEGIVIRSRFPIDKKVIDKASNLKFIARVGAGLENIDVAYAASKNISLIAAPEGNRNAVGEHLLGMLLSLMNNLQLAHTSVQKGEWLREPHRGWELEGKTVGLIGYGNTGKSFAKKLKGFEVKVLCHDIKPNVGDENAEQVSLAELQNRTEILSLHIPQTEETRGMINQQFIERMKNPFWFLNSARGKAVVTKDLVKGLIDGKIRGAALDVLEYESSSFHSAFEDKKKSKTLDYLVTSDRVLLSPHIAGWTFESHKKLALTIVKKIASLDS